MIRINSATAELLDEIVAVRRSAYVAKGRDSAAAETWARDEFDWNAVHVTAHDANGGMIGVVRVIVDGPWSLEKYFPHRYDKDRGVEFGRLAVTEKFRGSRRVLFDLVAAACRYGDSIGRDHAYGFLIDSFRAGLERAGVPFVLLSSPIAPYGEPSFLTRFDFSDLLEYYSDHAVDEAQSNAG